MIEEDKVHQFFAKLDDKMYSTMRNQILAHNPFLSLDKFFKIVQEEEKHKRVIMQGDRD